MMYKGLKELSEMSLEEMRRYRKKLDRERHYLKMIDHHLWHSKKGRKAKK